MKMTFTNGLTMLIIDIQDYQSGVVKEMWLKAPSVICDIC